MRAVIHGRVPQGEEVEEEEEREEGDVCGSVETTSAKRGLRRLLAEHARFLPRDSCGVLRARGPSLHTALNSVPRRAIVGC